MGFYQGSGFLGLAPNSPYGGSISFVKQVEKSWKGSNKIFSFYLAHSKSQGASSIQFGGYELSYAKEGSTKDDIMWADL